MVTRSWSFAARRRILLYAPAAALGAVLFLMAGYPVNGVTVLGGALMISAAFAAVFDNDETMPAVPAGKAEDHA